MRGFARRSTVEDALGWLDRQIERLGEETVPLADLLGRVLAREVVSRVDVPCFERSMMDGFAVRAVDSMGASPYNRLAIDVVGQSLPGRPFAGKVTPGKAVRIMTGAPMPDGADAVLPVELVEIDGDRILAQGDVSPGKHVGRIGEDVAAGTTVLPAGRMPRPQDVGLLASIGVGEVPVVRRPRVRIVVTGNELLPVPTCPRVARACHPAQPYKIVDSNGLMLAALVRRDGGAVIDDGIVPDEPQAILDAMRSKCDLVLISGGSSVGQEDHAPALLIEHGELPIHGIAMRPSSPTGMGRLLATGGSRLVFLLPGNPVSCLCAYDFFAGRAIRTLGGRSSDWPYRRINLPLAGKIVSVVGRLDYLRVRLVENHVEPLAIAGASILSSTTRADGFVLVPPDSEGYPPGAVVEVFLYD
jgi:molybdopterin molybdotransferase